MWDGKEGESWAGAELRVSGGGRGEEEHTWVLGRHCGPWEIVAAVSVAVEGFGGCRDSRCRCRAAAVVVKALHDLVVESLQLLILVVSRHRRRCCCASSDHQCWAITSAGITLLLTKHPPRAQYPPSSSPVSPPTRVFITKNITQ